MQKLKNTFKQHDKPFIFVCTLCLFSFLYAFGCIKDSIDIVPEVTDVSYIISLLTKPQDYEIQPHTFGKLWVSIFGYSDIIQNRLLHLLLLILSAVILHVRFLPSPMSFDGVLFFMSTLGVFLSLYGTGIVDPTYSSVSMVCAVFIMTISCKPIITSNAPLDDAIRSISIGFLLAALMIAKATTVGFVGILISILFYNSVSERRVSVYGFAAKCSLWALLGALMFLAFLWGRGLGSPYFTIHNLLESLIIFSELKAHSFEPGQIIWQFLLIGYWIFPELNTSNLAIILICCTPISLKIIKKAKTEESKNYWLLFVLIVPSTICGMFIIYLDFISSNLNQTDSYMATRILLILFLGLLWHKLLEKDYKSFLQGVIWLLLPIALIFGTNNSYYYYFPLYSGLWVFGSLSLAKLRSGRLSADSFVDGSSTLFMEAPKMIMISASLIMFFQASLLKEEPYRFHGSLNANLEYITFGPQQLELKGTKGLNSMYRSVEHLRGMDNSKILIDWTGRAPGIALHLGYKAPKIPWLIGSYPGEDEFGMLVLESISNEQIAKALFIVSDKMTRDPEILIERLEKVGRRFPEDYEVVATFYEHNLNSTNQIFAPK